MFPDFPQFVPLSLELKEHYNKAVSPYVPYADISFATLQIWWNISEQLAVSQLNQNLVINYHIAFDPANSGLSLVGTNNIDSSLEQLFAYLKQQGQPARLVHEPEFVVQHLVNKQRYTLTEELDYNEYILESAALAKLEGSEYQLLRKKIRRFIKHVGDKQLEIKELDLALGEVQDELFKAMSEWSDNNTPDNDPKHTEHLAIAKSFRHANDLGIKNLALYIDKQLQGLVVYHRPLGKEYFVLHHMKANYSHPYISDYLHHSMAKKAVGENVDWLNVEMDLGIENLRRHKMTLRPAKFLHKYTISPAFML